MNVTQVIVLPSDLFSFQLGMFRWVAEMSDLSGHGFKNVSEGFIMVNSVTGGQSVFTLQHTERGADELLYWDFVSGSVVARVFND